MSAVFGVGLAATLVLGAGPAGPTSFYTSWTPDPSGVDRRRAAAAATTCTSALPTRLATQQAARSRAQFIPSRTASAYRPVVVERRGDYVFTALVTAEGSLFTCLSDDATPRVVESCDGARISLSGQRVPRVHHREVEGGGGSHVNGREGGYGYELGRVGDDVTAVLVHVGGRAVQATVADGWFAAWWPETNEHAWTDVRYDVTLRDGTVRRAVPADFVKRADLDPAGLGPVDIDRRTGGARRTMFVEGTVGSDVVAVAVFAGPHRRAADLTGTSFGVEMPDAEGPLRYELTLRDGSVRTAAGAP